MAISGKFGLISGKFGLISGKFGLISGKGMNKSSIEQGMNMVCATRATLSSWFFISCRGIDSTVVV